MDIYWIQDKQRRGPATVPDILSLIQMGELTPETLGWHAGCSGWLPLRDLPALADFLHDTEQEEEEENAEEEAPARREQEVPTSPHVILAVGVAPSPMTRLLARVLDTCLYCVLALGLLHFSGVAYNATLLPGSPLFWIPMLLLEAFFLSKWKTTPGKRLLGIVLLPREGSPTLAFTRALFRSILVFFLGVGMYLFPLSLLMMGYTGWRLRRLPVTLWDERTQLLPIQHKASTPVRVLTAVIAIYLSLNAAGFFLQPWIPDMLDEMEQNSPQAAQTLRRFVESSLPSSGKE